MFKIGDIIKLKKDINGHFEYLYAEHFEIISLNVDQTGILANTRNKDIKYRCYNVDTYFILDNKYLRREKLKKIKLENVKN
jgi:hypothetical protein